MRACQAERLELSRRLARAREKMAALSATLGPGHPKTELARTEVQQAQDALMALAECGE